MNKYTIEKRMIEIQKEYSKTDYPKKYMRDNEYIKLKNQKRMIIEQEINEQKLQKELELSRKEKQESFNNMPDEVKKLLSDHKYNIFLDPDNILSFYPSKDTPLANKIMNMRLPH